MESVSPSPSSDETPAAERTAAHLLAVGRERIPIFSPNMLGPEITKKIFVVREPLRDRIVENVRAAADGRPGVRNSLLIAGRGGGKSTLVQVVYYKVHDDPALYPRLRVAWQPEDEMDITSWQAWIVRILRALAIEYGGEANRLNLLADKFRAMKDHNAAEREGEQALREFMGDRGLFLLVENLDFILDGILGEQGNEGLERFRQFFESLPKSTIMATSPSFDTEKFDRLSGFFHTEFLRELDAHQAQGLLTKIARNVDGDTKLAEQLERPETIQRLKVVGELAGGSPRIWILFSDAISLKKLDQLISLFRELIDKLTPLYQERLRNLPPQERRIVTFLVDAGGAVPVNEIADACRLTPPACAALLHKLTDKSYAERANETVPGTGDRRKVFYELREPLMRFCLKGKESRGEPLSLIVEFLCLWFDKPVLQERLKQLTGNEGSYEHMTLSAAVQHVEDRRFSGETTAPAMTESGKNSNDIKNSDLERRYKEISNLFNRDQYDRALVLAQELVRLYPDSAAALGVTGSLLAATGDPTGSAMMFEKAFQLLDQTHTKSDALIAARVWVCFGNAEWYKTKDYTKALESYDKAVEIEPEYAAAWRNCGWALLNLSRYDEALKACDKALEIDPEYVLAWNNRGNSLDDLERYDEAIEAYDRAVEIDPRFATAWNNRGGALGNLNRHDEALKAFDKALEIDPEYVLAWNNRGASLYHAGRQEEWKKHINIAGAIEAKSKRIPVAAAEALFARSNAAWDVLREAITSERRYESGLGAAAFFLMQAWLKEPERCQLWPERVAALTERFADAPPREGTELGRDFWGWEEFETADRDTFGLLPRLSNALTATLGSLFAEAITPDIADAWLAAWEAAAGTHAGMQIALRLLRAAVQWKRTRDRGILLRLPKEERSVLEKILKDTLKTGDA